MQIPANYRENIININGQAMHIAGLANPDNSHDYNNVNDLMHDLNSNYKIEVMIGLHQKKFTTEAAQNNIQYNHIEVEDLPNTGKLIPIETYDKIYNVVKQAQLDGKKVAIHCGAGDGRTGTALASLKLRELIEQNMKQDIKILTTQDKKDQIVHTSWMGKDIQCTPLVKQAVEEIRNSRIPLNQAPTNGEHSVETENDILTLMQYETHLKKTLLLEHLANIEPLKQRINQNIIILQDCVSLFTEEKQLDQKIQILTIDISNMIEKINTSLIKQPEKALSMIDILNTINDALTQITIVIDALDNKNNKFNNMIPIITKLHNDLLDKVAYKILNTHATQHKLKAMLNIKTDSAKIINQFKDHLNSFKSEIQQSIIKHNKK